MKRAKSPSENISESEEEVMGLLKFITRRSDASSFDERVEYYLTLKATNTQRAYRTVIKEWQDYMLGRNANLMNPSEKDVFGYVSEMLKKTGEPVRGSDGGREPCTPATVHWKVVILRGFYKDYFDGEGRCFDSAKERLSKFQTGSKRPTEVINGEQTNYLLNFNWGSSKGAVRNKGFLHILFGAGFRISETLNVSLSDVRQDGEIYYLFIREQKNKKYEDQPLDPESARAVNELKQQRMSEGAGPRDKLIVAYRGRTENPSQGLSEKGGYNLFKDLCKIAQLPENLSPHSGRATAATHLLASGEDWGSVKDYLRHSSISMVVTYDHRLKKRKNHPGLRLNYKPGKPTVE